VVEQASYVVVLRAPSGARFDPDEPPLTAVDFPTAVGPARFVFRTRYADENFSVPVPRELWVDARGSAPSLSEAINAFWNAAQSLLTVVALSANAPIDDLDVHLAYDNTLGEREREFFEQFLPEERGIPRQGRRTNIAATVAVFQALAHHPENERLLRAVGQYHLALSNWKRGYETLALAHLYMAMEVLTPVARRERCQAEQLSVAELAAAWGIEMQRLDSEVRLRLLFQSDAECYKQAREASDGFEHGFLPFHDVRARAAEVRDRTASYVRRAILDLARVDEVSRAILLSPPYDRPLEWWPLTQYLWGRLLGANDRLAAAGQEYPLIRWERSIKSISRTETGEYQIDVAQNCTAVLGDGVMFRPEAHEVWGPAKEPPQPRH
jgi:hypothetical protein